MSAKNINLYPSFDSEEVNRLLRQRRSLFPKNFSGEIVERELVEQILINAHFAPNHGRTEPWHLIVMSGAALSKFGKAHAALYKAETAEESFNQRKFDKLEKRPTECSHVIAICMKPGTNPKIPLIEEIEAVACAVQNMYLTTTALGLAGYWSSGGMTYHEGMKKILGLGENDQCLGFFMLGKPKPEMSYPDHNRKTEWHEKVEWWEE